MLPGLHDQRLQPDHRAEDQHGEAPATRRRTRWRTRSLPGWKQRWSAARSESPPRPRPARRPTAARHPADLPLAGLQPLQAQGLHDRADHDQDHDHGALPMLGWSPGEAARVPQAVASSASAGRRRRRRTRQARTPRCRSVAWSRSRPCSAPPRDRTRPPPAPRVRPAGAGPDVISAIVMPPLVRCSVPGMRRVSTPTGGSRSATGGAPGRRTHTARTVQRGRGRSCPRAAGTDTCHSRPRDRHGLPHLGLPGRRPSTRRS